MQYAYSRLFFWFYNSMKLLSNYIAVKQISLGLWKYKAELKLA